MSNCSAINGLFFFCYLKKNKSIHCNVLHLRSETGGIDPFVVTLLPPFLKPSLLIATFLFPLQIPV